MRYYQKRVSRGFEIIDRQTNLMTATIYTSDEVLVQAFVNAANEVRLPDPPLPCLSAPYLDQPTGIDHR